MDCDVECEFENFSVIMEVNLFVYLVLYDVKGEGERILILLFCMINKKFFYFVVCVFEG